MILNTGCCHHEHGWGEPVPVSAAIVEGCRTSGFKMKCNEKYQTLKVLIKERKISSNLLDENMNKLKKLCTSTGHNTHLAVTKKIEKVEEEEEEEEEEKVGGEEKTTMTSTPSTPSTLSTPSAPPVPSLHSFDFINMPEAVGVAVDDASSVLAEDTVDIVARLESFLPLAPSFPSLSGSELEAVLPVAPTNNVAVASVELNVTEEEEKTPTLA